MIANLKFIIESLVFVSETPLSLNRLKAILEDADPRDIRLALAELKGEYDDRQGGFTLEEVAGGYQFRTRTAYSEWIKKLLKPSPTRLSRAALETLAIIAYKQPIIRADVEHIRGVDSGGVLRLLLEKKLIRVLGRKDIPGRPMIYGTTRDFLALFNLKDLSELPSPKEITSLGAPDTDGEADSEDAHTVTAPTEGPVSPADVSPETGSAGAAGPTAATQPEDTETPTTPTPSPPDQPPAAVAPETEKQLSHFETTRPAAPHPEASPGEGTAETPAAQAVPPKPEA